MELNQPNGATEIASTTLNYLKQHFQLTTQPTMIENIEIILIKRKYFFVFAWDNGFCGIFSPFRSRFR